MVLTVLIARFESISPARTFHTTTTRKIQNQMIQLNCSSIDELNELAIEKADSSFDLENNVYEINDLFVASRSLLKKAGSYKQQQDYERCYGYLIQYLVLVKKKLPLHPSIEEHHDEYEYNLRKCDLVKSELSQVKKILIDLYSDAESIQTTDRVASPAMDERQYNTTAVPHQQQKTLSQKKSVRPLPGLGVRSVFQQPTTPTMSSHDIHQQDEYQEEEDSSSTDISAEMEKRMRTMYLQAQIDPFYDPTEDPSRVLQNKIVRIPMQQQKQQQQQQSNSHVQFLGEQQINFRRQ
jgi:hypothetical protein